MAALFVVLGRGGDRPVARRAAPARGTSSATRSRDTRVGGVAVVMELAPSAAGIAVEPGDRILEVNGQPYAEVLRRGIGWLRADVPNPYVFERRDGSLLAARPAAIAHGLDGSVAGTLLVHGLLLIWRRDLPGDRRGRLVAQVGSRRGVRAAALLLHDGGAALACTLQTRLHPVGLAAHRLQRAAGRRHDLPSLHQLPDRARLGGAPPAHPVAALRRSR